MIFRSFSLFSLSAFLFLFLPIFALCLLCFLFPGSSPFIGKNLSTFIILNLPLCHVSPRDWPFVSARLESRGKIGFGFGLAFEFVRLKGLTSSLGPRVHRTNGCDWAVLATRARCEEEAEIWSEWRAPLRVCCCFSFLGRATHAGSDWALKPTRAWESEGAENRALVAGPTPGIRSCLGVARGENDGPWFVRVLPAREEEKKEEKPERKTERKGRKERKKNRTKNEKIGNRNFGNERYFAQIK